jgi:hypothetical protein
MCVTSFRELTGNPLTVAKNSGPSLTGNQKVSECIADPSGSAVSGVGLRPLAYWDCGFESHRGHGCLSVVSVVCCQVEVSATGWSFVRRSPTERGVSKNCDREVLSVVFCQVEVSATGWSFVRRSPTECGVSKNCDREASRRKWGGLGSQVAVEPLKKKWKYISQAR